MKPAVRAYRGWIAEHDCGEAQYIVFLSEVNEPLAQAIENDMDSFGCWLSVRYFISTEAKTLDELTEDLVKNIIGAGTVEYHSYYSEITGYLWTDENIVVGGHDLLKELRAHKGKFAHLEIKFLWKSDG